MKRSLAVFAAFALGLAWAIFFAPRGSDDPVSPAPVLDSATDQGTASVASEEIASTSFEIDGPRAQSIGSPGARVHMMTATAVANMRVPHPDYPDWLPVRVLQANGSPAENMVFDLNTGGAAPDTITTDGDGLARIPVSSGMSRQHSPPFDPSLFRSTEMRGVFNETPGALFANGVVVFTLPRIYMTFHGEVESAWRRDQPLANTEIIFSTRRYRQTVQGATFDNGWRTPGIRLPDREIDETVTTDSEGLFEITDYPFVTTRGNALHVRHSDPLTWTPKSPVFRDRRQVALGIQYEDGQTDPAKVRTFLLTEPLPLRVLIIDGETEQPIVGLPIELSESDQLADTSTTMTTDDAGRFTVERLPGMERGQSYDPGFAIEFSLTNTPHRWAESPGPSLHHVITSGQDLDITLRVRESDMLTIETIDPAGNPIAGASVWALMSNRQPPDRPTWELGTTDENGLLILGKPDWGGDVLFGARHSDWPLILSEPTALAGKVLITAQAVPGKTLRFALRHANGEPVQSWVHIERNFITPDGTVLPHRESSLNTDENGIAVCENHPLASTRFSVHQSDLPRMEIVVDLTAGNLPDPIPLVIPDPEESTLRGKVTNQFGEPIADALVITEWDEEQRTTTLPNGNTFYDSRNVTIHPITSVRTDADGRFEITAKGGQGEEEIYWIVEAEGHARCNSSINLNRETHLVLPQALTLSGQLLGIDPVEHQQMKLRLDRAEVTAPIMAEGLFATLLHDRAQEQHPRNRPLPPRPVGPTDKTLVIEVGDDLFAEIPVTITHEPGQEIALGAVDMRPLLDFSVRVTDPSGEPLEGAVMMISPASVNQPVQRTTGQDGTTEVVRIAGGDHQITVTHAEHHRHLETLNLSASTQHPVTLQLWEAYSIDLTFHDTEGSPLVGQKVQLRGRLVDDSYENPNRLELNEFTDATGRVEFTGIPRGHFYATAWLGDSGGLPWLAGNFPMGEGPDEMQSYKGSMQLPEFVPITIRPIGLPEHERLHISVRHTLPMREGIHWSTLDNIERFSGGEAEFLTVQGENRIDLFAMRNGTTRTTIEVHASNEVFEIELTGTD